MKHVWIWNGVAGLVVFSNPKKAYNEAGIKEFCSYSKYLRQLRTENQAIWDNGTDEQCILKIKVE
jgi:hypothetical protein